MRLKFLIGLGAIGVAGGLVILVGLKLSADAVAIILGVIIGVLGSIPTALILIWAFSRQLRPADEGPDHPSRPGHYPPVVVVNPGQLPAWSQPPPSLPAPNTMRRYQVVGDFAEEEGYDHAAG